MVRPVSLHAVASGRGIPANASQPRHAHRRARRQIRRWP